MYFPSLCFDNFFNRPDEIRDLALSLEYEGSQGNLWPGKRTQPLHLVSEQYFNLFTKKVLSLFPLVDLSYYECFTYFQMIEPYAKSGIRGGWVHTDADFLLAGVVYLSPNINPNSGTTIFRPKKVYNTPINHEHKKEMYLNSKSEKDILDIKREENNDLFEETLVFKNVYNRMIAYDGSTHHSHTNFEFDESDFRLTQVFFFDKIVSRSFPGPECKRIQL